jgi:hypothetical protein
MGQVVTKGYNQIDKLCVVWLESKETGNENAKKPSDLSKAVKPLKRLEKELQKTAAALTGTASRYYQTVIEGPNKGGKRKERTNIIRKILAQAD